MKVLSMLRNIKETDCNLYHMKYDKESKEYLKQVKDLLKNDRDDFQVTSLLGIIQNQS